MNSQTFLTSNVNDCTWLAIIRGGTGSANWVVVALVVSIAESALTVGLFTRATRGKVTERRAGRDQFLIGRTH
jgi:hypothetical protein